MPINKNQLRRWSKILDLLNENIDRYLHIKDIEKMINNRIDIPVSRSTIEKDLVILKEDFDVDFENKNGRNGGVKLYEKVDFIGRLTNLIK